MVETRCIVACVMMYGLHRSPELVSPLCGQGIVLLLYYMFVLLELLFVKFGYFTVSRLSHADITHSIDDICTS